MNRRTFLALAPALAGFALDPERLLWVPGRKSYFDIVRPEPATPFIMVEFADGTREYYTERNPMRADWYASMRGRIVMIDQLS